MQKVKICRHCGSIIQPNEQHRECLRCGEHFVTLLNLTSGAGAGKQYFCPAHATIPWAMKKAYGKFGKQRDEQQETGMIP